MTKIKEKEKNFVIASEEEREGEVGGLKRIRYKGLQDYAASSSHSLL